jgi:hypothetical protein
MPCEVPIRPFRRLILAAVEGDDLAPLAIRDLYLECGFTDEQAAGRESHWRGYALHTRNVLGAGLTAWGAELRRIISEAEAGNVP